MMKKYLLIGFLSISLKVSFSQYLTLPKSNAFWLLKADNGFGGYYFPGYEVKSSNSDTIINTTAYTKIFSGSYLGAFQSSINGKTYFVPKDSTQELLLYDFSKNKGDTIYNILRLTIGGHYELFNSIVDSVEYIISGPKMLKQILLKDDAGNSWIESVGSTRGFFNRDAVGLSSKGLDCMSYNDTTYYPNWALGRCNLNKGEGVEEISILSHFNIYPNPNNGSMQIDYTLPENEPGQFEVFDLAGKKMLSYPLKGGKNGLTISNADLANGIYLYQLLSNDRVIAKDKLVIIK